MRPSKRQLDEMRVVSVETGFSKHAEGSCLIKMGDTHVLVHGLPRRARTALVARWWQRLGNG